MIDPSHSNRPLDSGAAKQVPPSTNSKQDKVQRVSRAIPGPVKQAKALAGRLKGALEAVRQSQADQAQNVIVRWKGDALLIKALPTEAKFYQQIAFTILKLFIHDKQWKSRLINDIKEMAAGLPAGESRDAIIKSSLAVARSILQTGSFYGSAASIEADRQMRVLINELSPPQGQLPTQSPDAAIQAALALAHGRQNPDEVDLSHIIGSSIATSVGGKLGSGGYGCWTSAHELMAVRSLPQERPKIQAYTASAQRSLPLNVRLQEAQRKSIFQDAAYFTQLAADFKLGIDELAQDSSRAIFMDCNYKGHVMRAVFKRDADGFVVAKLYDTSGDLEAMRGNFLTGNLRALLGTKQKLCMEIHIEAHAFAEQGQAWLEQVIAMDSKDTHQKMEHQHLSAEARSKAFRDVFASIPGTQMTSAMDYAQTTGNCYSKRLDAAQRDQLGDELYLELRLQQYALMKPELERILGRQRFDGPKALGRKKYRRLRNKLRRYPKKAPLGDGRFAKLALRMYQHDQAVMETELAHLRSSRLAD